MALKIRRGTEAERVNITPAEGELIYTTDTKLVWVGDGSTEGGVQVTGTGGGGTVGLLEVSDDNTPQLGGNLDLNNFSIIGTGEINIDGNIYATGNISLGDNPADTINVGGQITGSLVPVTNDAYTLGSNSNRWGDVFATDINVSGDANLTDITLSGVIRGSDSSVLIDGGSSTIVASNLVAANINGDLKGSVFGGDSSLVLDVDNAIVFADVDANDVSTGNLNAATVVLGGTNALGDRAGITIVTDGTSDDAYNLFTISGANDSEVGNSLVFSRSRGTPDIPTALQAEDEVMGIAWLGADQNGVPVPTSAVQAYVDGPVSSGIVPGRLALGTATVAGEIAPAIIMNSAQQTQFTGAIMLATYLDAAERDAAVTSPVGGMLVFITSTSKAQVYDGTAWVDLH